jgi:hypothetical protein
VHWNEQTCPIDLRVILCRSHRLLSCSLSSSFLPTMSQDTRPTRSNTLTQPAPPERPSLVDRLQATAWKAPDPHRPCPPPAAIDAAYPFQVSCCELTGSVCAPMMLYYRDTATILYRVQQHVRKIVPQVYHLQTQALGQSRSAQRGILDVTDSLAMIDTLNAPVQKAFGDITARALATAGMLREERKQREKARHEKLNASSSLPTTPADGEATDAVSGDLPTISIPGTSSPRGSSTAVTPQGTPQRRHPNTPASVVVAAATPRASSSSSAAATGSGAMTPSRLKAKIAGVFSPTAAATASAASSSSSTGVTAGNAGPPSLDLHPSVADPQNPDHEDVPPVHPQSISAFVP